MALLLEPRHDVAQSQHDDDGADEKGLGRLQPGLVESHVVPVAGRTPSAELELLRGAEALAKVPLQFDAPIDGRIQQLCRVPIETLEAGDYTFRVVVVDGRGREVRETSIRVVD